MKILKIPSFRNFFLSFEIVYKQEEIRRDKKWHLKQPKIA